MRLYLSSYKVGNHPDQLVALLRGNKKIAVIKNAVDYADPVTRAGSVERAIQDLRDIGLDAEELDLREYIGKQDALAEKLSRYGGVWVAGGNVFVLNLVVRATGFDTVIKKLLQEDKLVYGGYSAGAVLATPTLKGIELVDDVTLAYTSDSTELVWDGLGLVGYSIAPHYRSDHHESAAIDNTVAYFEQHHMPYKALQDGEVIVVENGKETLLG